MRVSITYCVPWNFLPQASRVEQELKDNFENVTVEFIKGSGGIFDVKVDNKMIFSKDETDRFPEDGEITRLIKP